MNIVDLSKLAIVYGNTETDSPYLQSQPFKSLKIENEYLKNCLVTKFNPKRHETNYDLFSFYLMWLFKSSVAETLMCMIIRCFQTPVGCDVM